MSDELRSRLFAVLYFSERSSRSSALRYGLPSCISFKTTWGAGGCLGGSEKLPQSYNPRRPPRSVHLKIKMAVLTVRRAISQRSHEKIGDCEQSS